MTANQIIVLATPVFVGLIVLEWAWGQRVQRRGTGQQTYQFNDALNSLGLGLMSQITSTVTALLRLGIYAAVYHWLPLSDSASVQAFWTCAPGWLLALLCYDFCYYWLHRMGHEVGVLWAAHVVHHQSQRYNLTTALRQTSSGAALGWLFYVPMAALGVPPLVFATVGLIDLLYQFWVHTEHVPKLGWFDRWFCSPSNHRVHHAVNDEYLDRNYGGILIAWDRLFGTFQEERDDLPCVYGTRSPLQSWDPLWANAEGYAALAQDSWRTRRWRDKLRVWIAPPGWRPADVAASHPREAFRLERVTLYNPPTPPIDQLVSALLFVVSLVGGGVFLWHAEGLPTGQLAMGVGTLCATLWITGALSQGRWSIAPAGSGSGLALMLVVGVLAALANGMGWREAYAGMKPLPLALGAISIVWATRPRLDGWLLAAFAASWLGDVILLQPGGFLFGLIAFLLAHLCYIQRLRPRPTQPGGWPPAALTAALLAYTAALVTYLFTHGLPASMRLPVAGYVGAIVTMGLLALGRWTRLRTPGALQVAAGGLLFIASDSLLAIDTFVAPTAVMGLPSSYLLLMCYFIAQWLIAVGLLRDRAVSPR